jgi:hypothetical protein
MFSPTVLASVQTLCPPCTSQLHSLEQDAVIFASDSNNKSCFNAIRLSASNVFQIFHNLLHSSRIYKLRIITDITVRGCAEISYSGIAIIPVAKLIPLLRYFTQNFVTFILVKGFAVAQLVEALHYKPKGRGFHSRWCHWNFSLA